MIKKIMFVSLAVVIGVVGVGVFVHANAQIPSAACPVPVYVGACGVGQATTPVTSGGVTTWTCINGNSFASCSSGAATSATSAPTTGVCGSAADSCAPGNPTNEGTQYCSAGSQVGDCSSIGTGDYYYWNCNGINGGGQSNQCYAAVSAGQPAAVPGVSCTSNSQCATGAQCTNGQCTAIPFQPTPVITIACTYNDNCSLGQVCVNPGVAAAYCALPGNNSNGNTETIAQVLSAYQGQVCTGAVTTNLSAAQACDQLFTNEANALGYSTQCTDSLVNYGAAADAPYYNSACTLTGNGLLGQMNGTAFLPYDVAGATSGSSQSWQTVEGYAQSGNSVSSVPATTQPVQTQPQTTVTTTSGAPSNQNSSVSTLNINLSSALSGFSSVLQSINSAANAAGQTNVATTAAGTSSATAGTTTSGATGVSTTASNTCASAAASTVANSLQTLQSLATILSGGNVSAGVLTSIQNLINAVAQVLSALSSCVSGGGQ